MSGLFPAMRNCCSNYNYTIKTSTPTQSGQRAIPQIAAHAEAPQTQPPGAQRYNGTSTLSALPLRSTFPGSMIFGLKREAHLFKGRRRHSHCGIAKSRHPNHPGKRGRRRCFLRHRHHTPAHRGQWILYHPPGLSEACETCG